jgi:hypothetical protein
VLLQYQGTLANIPKAFEPSIERSATLVASYQPDADLTAFMERYRTSPLRPVPQLYESASHDESDVVFGIDLRGLGRTLSYFWRGEEGINSASANCVAQFRIMGYSIDCGRHIHPLFSVCISSTHMSSISSRGIT